MPKRTSFCLVLLGLFFLGSPLLAQYNVLHSFEGGTSDGDDPQGNVTLVGTTLYGTTRAGGTGNKGILFKIGIDGFNFQVLHNFGSDDGNTAYYPYGSLTAVGSTLYGAATCGEHYGAIYKIGTDGNNFAIVHEFQRGTADGAVPVTAPILSGSTFYGMTEEGGASNLGIIYKMDLDGGNFAVLHTFTGGTDGAWPHGGLLLDGSTLYGMTSRGGSTSDYGTVFKIGTDGNNYQILHVFTGGTTDGWYPDNGTLVLNGATLYGMTNYGGSSNYGTVFRIDTNGANFEIVWSFGFTVTDGAWPHGSLILVGSKLYGMTYAGGQYHGTLFGLGLGGGISVLHSFGNTGDGAYPYWSLIESGGYFYGMTNQGGAYGDHGTIFRCAPDLADISVSMAPDKMAPAQGESVTYTITVTNNGPCNAKYVRIHDALPAGIAFQYGGGDGYYNANTGVFDVNSNSGDTLTVGSSAILTLSGTVRASGTIANTAELWGLDCMDQTGSNDSSTVNINPVVQSQLLPPVLLTPASSATNQPSAMTFKWADTNGNPQEVKYKLRLKKQGGSYVNTTLAQNTTQYTKSGLAAGKVYSWNVMAVGNGTSIKNSAWANGGIDYSFTVAPPVTLTAPTLNSPANGATGQPLSVTLKWSDPNTAELHYKVRFKIAGGAYTITTLGPGVTELVKSGLKSGKTYYWSVMALGNGTSIKNSVWPADSHFSTI